MTLAKKYIYAERFVGEPKLSDFKLVEEELSPLKDNGEIKKNFYLRWFEIKHFFNFLEVLTEALYLSVDPYMRAYVDSLQIGQTMIGGQVAKLDINLWQFQF